MSAPVATKRSRPSGETDGGVVLRYRPRAGLLPELSRQTYDQIYKALREAVLNAMDARATVVHLDFRELSRSRSLVIEDDGTGMSPTEFELEFMGLGGSSKYGDPAKFGRIGIGSLALLHYAKTAVIETKRRGDRTQTRAVLSLDLTEPTRRLAIDDIDAGTLNVLPYTGPATDHFTKLTLHDLGDEVATLGSDPGAFYGLVEDLRRVLPLPLGDSPVIEALIANDPKAGRAIAKVANSTEASVELSSPWDARTPLTRRLYGDDPANTECWSGPPVGFDKTLRVSEHDGYRDVNVLGFLVAQQHAIPRWSGLTVRVQNVAVEERSFFDVQADPGFRKYITGEVWLTGHLDRERLINIDRSSFNRESPDYREVKRHMAQSISVFKAKAVQDGQRGRVATRRVLRDHEATWHATCALVAEIHALTDIPRLPSSGFRQSPFPPTISVSDLVSESGAAVQVVPDEIATTFRISASKNDWQPVAVLGESLSLASVPCGSCRYRVAYIRAGDRAPAVVIRNRPRMILYNLNHCRHADDRWLPKALGTSLALELAYLVADPTDAADLHALITDLLDAVA